MANTFTWIGPVGTAAVANDAVNWTVSNGVNGPPSSGDTAIVNAGGTAQVGDGQLAGNVVFLNGATGGGTNAARMMFTGDPFVSFASLSTGGHDFGPSLDQFSTITTATAPGGDTGIATVGIVDADGNFINEGTILAAGAAGSSLTLNVGGTTIGGTFFPGYAYNYNLIEADAGDSLTISVGPSSELFNAGRIVANGGSILIAANALSIAGGLAPVAGLVEIEAGGTVETEAAYASNIVGSAPLYGFADATAGNTLKIDNIGGFGGRIVGFQQSDTIDLGTSIAVGTIAFDPTTGILSLEDSAGATLDTLVLSTGGFQSGAFAVNNSGTAGSFVIGTNAAGDSVLTTTALIPNATTSGSWQSAALWSTGSVPGTLDTPFVGLGVVAPFVVTTGATAVSVLGVDLVSAAAALRITSNTTATGVSDLIGGTLEVTGGNTFTAGLIRELTAGSSLTVDTGATIAVSGRDSLSLSNINGVSTVLAQSGTVTNLLGVLVSGGAMTINGSVLAGSAGGIRGSAFEIGLSGGGAPASVTVNAGGVVTDSHAILGSDPVSYGVLTLTGSLASWTDVLDTKDPLSVHGDMFIGYNSLSSNTPGGTTPPAPVGTARLTVEQGAILTEQAGAVIADTPNSAGSVTIQTGGVWNLSNNGTGYLGVGNVGSGTLNVLAGGTVLVGTTGNFLSNGTTQSFGGIGIGKSAGAAGTILVSGAGALLTDSGGSSVGRSGQALLAIQNGGSVVFNPTGAAISVGTTAGPGSSGTILIGGSGAAAQMTVAATSTGMVIGAASAGTLAVEDGGTLLEDGNFNGTSGGITVGQSATASGLIFVGGSTAAAGITLASRGMVIGGAGTGVVTIGALGTIALNGTSGIGIGATNGATGTLIVSGGLLTESATGTGIGVGQATASGGSDMLQILNGGTVALAGGSISMATTTTGDAGTLLVSDAGSLLRTTGSASVLVGNVVSGTGVVTVQNGGSISDANRLVIGAATSSTGSVSVIGGAITANSVTIAATGATAGTLSIGAGGTVTATSGGFLNAGGTLALSGGTLALGGNSLLNLSGSAQITGFGRVSGAGLGFISGTPTIVATGGLLELPLGGGAMTIAAGATLELDQIPGSGSVSFAAGNAGTLMLANPTLPTTETLALTNLRNFDRVEFHLAPNVTPTSAMLSGGTLVIATQSGGNPAASSSFTNVSVASGQSTEFTVGTDSSTGLAFVEVACFVSGTRIRTADGLVPVEHLAEGMRVPTVRDGGSAPIVWIGRRTVDCRRHPAPETVWPVRIAAGAFGPGTPRRALWLSPDHAVFVNGALVPAKLLVNGTTIRQVPRRTVTYWHVELPAHAVILAEDLPVESYLDTGDRRDFAAGEVVRLHPDFASRLSLGALWEAKGAAPLVLAGPALEDARRAVAGPREAGARATTV